MALPDITDLVLDRLAANMAEIGNGLTVMRYEPDGPNIANAALPLSFFRVDATKGPSNRTANNVAVSERTYVITVLVKPNTRETFSASLGSPLLAEVEPWLSRIENYFLMHQWLETASLPKFFYRESGVWSLALNKEIGIGPDSGIMWNDAYAGIEFQLQIETKLSFKQPI